MEHVPAATIVTVAPLTVQTEVEFDAKLTVSPELAEAYDAIGNGATPNDTAGGCVNVMVCEDGGVLRNSAAPASHEAPCGRLAPVWSAFGGGQALGATKSMAALPDCSATVGVWPPLFAGPCEAS